MKEEGGGKGGYDIYDQWNNLVHRASKTKMAAALFRLRSVRACMIACMIEVKAAAGKKTGELGIRIRIKECEGLFASRSRL